jgi:sec-independent protein translocase protein TatA
MIGDLFDSPWKVLILAVVILVLFGSKKLPDAARSLGRSMRILKHEISDLHEGEEHGTSTTSTMTGQPVPPQPAQITQQEQVDRLQAQIDDLRRQSAEAQQTHQPS